MPRVREKAHQTQKVHPAVQLYGYSSKECAAPLGPAETEALARLTAMHRSLPVDGDYLDTRSQEGVRACEAFLAGIAELSVVMQAEQASRAYRSSFTASYASLFPCKDSRGYRLEILEASATQYHAMWANGERHYFTSLSLLRARELQKAWLELGTMLEHWADGARHVWLAGPLSCTDLQCTLVTFDAAWAQFEQVHISELITMEQRALDVLVQAAEHEHLLGLLERRHRNDRRALLQRADYRGAHDRLSALVARMSSAANDRRRGREDLDADVLLEAMSLVQLSCVEQAQAGLDEDTARATSWLARHVVESFAALRRYLREAYGCIERVDPHLRNNAELVALLASWEESWEIGRRYLQNATLCGLLGRLAAQLRVAQGLVPAFGAMCATCDAELFLVLPRIMWLCFLEEPSTYAVQMSKMLPHLFVGAGGPSETPGGSDALELGPELLALAGQFRSARRLLVQAAAPASAAAVEQSARHTLLRLAAIGRAPAGQQDHLLPDWLCSTARHAVEDLMHTLERWSIELQRHRPDEWNQWCAIVMRYVNDGSELQDDGRAHV